MSATIAVDGQLASVSFNRFDLDAYATFLRAKALPESQVSYDWKTDTYTLTTPARFADRLGADIVVTHGASLPIANHLFDYQRWALNLALDARRFALWLDTGLGKTAVYLEWARQVQALTGGRVLILAPLAVIPQTIREADRFYGDGMPITHLRTRDDLIAWCSDGNGVGICNYEKFIPGVIPELRLLAGLVADESSVLRTGGGKIKWNLIKSARGIEYKLSCTATPAPNEAMEYASQAAFLEKLRSEGDILWTWFTRDKYGEWTVKPHARDAFYRFMASWSLYLRNPATFGFGDILSTLPDPVITEERIELTDEQRKHLSETLIETGTGLFVRERISVTVRQKLSQIARGFVYHGKGSARTVERFPSHKMTRVADSIRESLEAGRGPVLVWTTFDEEALIISELLQGVSHTTLDGRMDEDARLAALDRFRSGELSVLISKPQLIGYGLNLQFVRSMVFAGFDDSFERMYQAVRRAYRFGQRETVYVHVPYVPELEGMIYDNINQKETRFLEEVAAQEVCYRIALREEGYIK